MMKYSKAAQTGKIETSLCGCCGDCGICCCAIWCYPCYSAHVWADARGEHCTCCHFYVFPANLWARENIRQARGMRQNFCGDCITDSCCPCCFLVQNMREIKKIQSIVEVPVAAPASAVNVNINNYAQEGKPSNEENN